VAVPALDAAVSPHARFLLDVIAKTGVKATAIAAKIGVPPSTLTRHLPNAKGHAKPGTPRTMHADVVAKLETFSGLAGPAGTGTTAAIAPVRRPVGGFGDDAARYVAEEAANAVDDALTALVGNRPNAYRWTVKSRAMERRGLLPGDHVIVDLSIEAQDGDIVLANAINDRKPHGADTALRILHKVRGVRILLAASDDPALQDPLIVDDDRIAVMGVVTDAVKRLRKRR
jgi:hypothetical protein